MRAQGHLRNAILMVTDALCVVLSWSFALWAYRAVGFGHYKFGFAFYLDFWPVLIAFIVVNAMFRLYHGSVIYPASPLSPVEELKRLVWSSVIVHIGTIAALAIAYQSTEHYSRAVILIAGALAAFASQPMRDAVRGLLKRFSIAQIPVELIGEGETASAVAAVLARDAYTGFRVVESSDVAIVCQDVREFRAALPDLSRRHTHIEFIPSGAIFPTYGAHAVSFDGIGGLEMVNQRRMSALRHEKWVLDKALAFTAFILLSPFFVIVPVLIKLTSRGPVFYRQDRLGKCGRPIRVWKFRSMYANADERLKAILAGDPAKRAEWEASFKLRDDPRVTPLGRFLRKTSIDEFPQLFNVFAGDMALVGPRPIVEKEVAYYGDAYETFSSVKPGITGLWQVSGRSDTDYPQRVALDVQYVLNWSPWMDIWILFRTVGAVFLMRGAR